DHRHDSVCDDLTMRRAALIGADLFPDSAVRAADSRTEQPRDPVIAGEVAAVSLNVPTEINTLVAVGEYGGARPAAQAVARCAVLLIPDAAIVARRRMISLSSRAARDDATNYERRRRNHIDSPSPRIGLLIHGRELLHGLIAFCRTVGAIAVPRSRRASGMSYCPRQLVLIGGRPAPRPLEPRCRQMRRAAEAGVIYR